MGEFGTLSYSQGIPKFYGTPIAEVKETNQFLMKNHITNQQSLDQLDILYNDIKTASGLNNDSDSKVKRQLVDEFGNSTDTFLQTSDLAFAGKFVGNEVKKFAKDGRVKGLNARYQSQVANDEAIDKMEGWSADDKALMKSSARNNTQELKYDPITNTWANNYAAYTANEYYDTNKILPDIISKIKASTLNDPKSDSKYYSSGVGVQDEFGLAIQRFVVTENLNVKGVSEEKIYNAAVKFLMNDPKYKAYMNTRNDLDKFQLKKNNMFNKETIKNMSRSNIKIGSDADLEYVLNETNTSATQYNNLVDEEIKTNTVKYPKATKEQIKTISEKNINNVLLDKFVNTFDDDILDDFNKAFKTKIDKSTFNELILSDFSGDSKAKSVYENILTSKFNSINLDNDIKRNGQTMASIFSYKEIDFDRDVKESSYWGDVLKRRADKKAKQEEESKKLQLFGNTMTVDFNSEEAVNEFSNNLSVSSASAAQNITQAENELFIGNRQLNDKVKMLRRHNIDPYNITPEQVNNLPENIKKEYNAFKTIVNDPKNRENVNTIINNQLAINMNKEIVKSVFPNADDNFINDVLDLDDFNSIKTKDDLRAEYPTESDYEINIRYNKLRGQNTLGAIVDITSNNYGKNKLWKKEMFKKAMVGNKGNNILLPKMQAIDFYNNETQNQFSNFVKKSIIETPSNFLNTFTKKTLNNIQDDFGDANIEDLKISYGRTTSSKMSNGGIPIVVFDIKTKQTKTYSMNMTPEQRDLFIKDGFSTAVDKYNVTKDPKYLNDASDFAAQYISVRDNNGIPLNTSVEDAMFKSKASGKPVKTNINGKPIEFVYNKKEKAFNVNVKYEGGNDYVPLKVPAMIVGQDNNINTETANINEDNINSLYLQIGKDLYGIDANSLYTEVITTKETFTKDKIK